MNREHKTYEIRCIAPVHVGCGEMLTPFDYLYDPRREEMIFLDPTRWASFLVDHQLIDKVADQLQQETSGSLMEWLKRERIAEGEMRKLAIRRAKAATAGMGGKGRRSLNNVAVHIALADGRPYIPGSSIKGALRTGILYRLLQNAPKLREKYWQRWMEIPVRAWEKETGKQITRPLEEELLHRLTHQKTRSADAVNSALRGLGVSDATVVSRVETVILAKRDASLMKSDPAPKDHPVALYRECLPAETKLRVSVSFDPAMMKTIGFSSLQEVMEAARAHFQAGLAMQEKVFGAYYKGEFAEAKEADLLLGGGTGFLAKTLFYALAPDERTAQRKVAEYLDTVFKAKGKSAHQHVAKDKITPRALKLVQLYPDRYIMGLCAMREVKGC